MPKVIENIRRLLLEEARRQVAEKGYGAVTVRSIAAACGVGLGTMYNYFPSKDDLIATYILEDWQETLEGVEALCREKGRPEEALPEVCVRMRGFVLAHQRVFGDAQAAQPFALAAAGRHKLLRSQLAGALYSVCGDGGWGDPGFLSEFLAEALLAWSVEGKAPEQLCPVLLKLFSPEKTQPGKNYKKRSRKWIMLK